MARKSTSSHNHCVLCGRTDAEVPFMLQGMDGYICSDCAKLAADYVAELEHSKPAKDGKGGIICIGSGCYDWYSYTFEAGYTEKYHKNIEIITKNAFNHLMK